MEETTRRALLRRAGTALLLTVVVSLPLAACGKKSQPEPPSGEEAPYPRTYPSGAAPS
ncbi:hypothetical protein [Hwanghaeella sp. 1Z406]|jgi:hypothetical protein|uniref:hypothetical protein n=1 Tax=Hwanghaeella sp. 1Z406 TaxID=3402811 RepID=UPI0026A0173E